MRRWTSLWIFLAFFGLYGSMAATTPQGGDASEFMAVAATFGTPHPPGYPLFVLLTWLSAHLLPWGTVAWRASLVASAEGAATLAVFFAALRPLTGARPARLAVGALGLSLTFWRYATVAEVFAGGALSAALVFWVCARVARGLRGPRAAALLGLALATGIANHHTIVLLAPLALYAVAVALPRDARGAAVSLSAGAVALLPGFGMYLLFLIPAGAWRWGAIHDLAGVVHHFLRRDYGTFSLGLYGQDVSRWAHPWAWLRALPQEFVGLYSALAVVGVVVGLGRRRDRGLFVALGASVLLAGPVFLSAFNLPARGASLVIATRFYILPNTLLAPFIALGAAGILERSRGRWVSPALFSGLLLAAALHGPEAGHRGWTVLDDYLRNVYATVEPDAVVIGSGDPGIFGSLYLQNVEGIRPDVAYIEPTMAGHPWYVEGVKAAHPGLRWDNTVPRDAVLEIIDQNVDQRPVYVAFRHYLDPHYLDRLPPGWPVGAVLMKVAGTGESPPPPPEVERELRAAMDRATLRSRVDTPFRAQSTWEYASYDQYALAFETLARAYERTGDGDGAARCRRTAAELSPFRFGQEGGLRH